MIAGCVFFEANGLSGKEVVVVMLPCFYVAVLVFATRRRLARLSAMIVRVAWGTCARREQQRRG